MKQIRTDLAIEAHEMLTEAAEELSGVSVDKSEENNMHVTRVRIESKEAEQKMGKPQGTYITIELPDLKTADNAMYEAECQTVARELRSLTKLPDDASVLVIGLGNWNITPDALGPQVVSRLMVTRHLHEYLPEAVGPGVRPVSALSPGVLGTTGMETSEIIRGVAEHVKPGLIIAVDALASRSMERISTTIQLCDTGISPGAGVGNKRKELSHGTLGIPVIAVGIPTVIDAATITADTFDSVIDSMLQNTGDSSPFFQMLQGLNREEQYALVRESLSPHLTDFMVTPKDIDMLIDKVSLVVANGINLALHQNLTFTDIEAYVS